MARMRDEDDCLFVWFESCFQRAVSLHVCRAAGFSAGRVRPATVLPRAVPRDCGQGGNVASAKEQGPDVGLNHAKKQ